MKKINRTKRLAVGSALILAGAGIGAAVSATGSASAEGTTSSGSSTSTTGPAGTAPDPTKPMRPDEKLLTGTTATRVRDLALAKYPGATIQRVETDSDGVYEAHMVTKAGARVIVKVGKDFAVTGVQTGGPGGRPGAPRRGDHDGDGPAMGGTPPAGSRPPAA